MTIYEAFAEDLTHLGGPMGTEYTTEESLGLFDSWLKAEKACVEHYGKPIKRWTRETHGRRTDDFGWVQYHIRERHVK